MGVTFTSREAYEEVDLPRAQKAVYEAIWELWNGHRGPSDQEVADNLGWSVNRVTGRRNELVEQGLIVAGGVKLNALGRKVFWWRPEPVQIEMFPEGAGRVRHGQKEGKEASDG